MSTIMSDLNLKLSQIDDSFVNRCTLNDILRLEQPECDHGLACPARVYQVMT